MNGLSEKKTSGFAIASVICIFLALCLLVLPRFCTQSQGIFIVPFIAIGITILSIVGFLLAIIALVVIAVRRDKLKGYICSILVILGFPLIFGTGSGLFVSWRRGETKKIYAGRNNLEILGKALVVYASDHNGYLPAADRWCDLLMNHNNSLAKSNFKHPMWEELNLGACNYAFNKHVGGVRLADVPMNVVLIFEADGDWNLNGEAELLNTRRSVQTSINILFADGSISEYWFYKKAVRKCNQTGATLYYEQIHWQL